MVVGVGMSHPSRHARMHVIVMSVVVPVAVGVVHGLMRMLVFVTSGQHHIYPHGHRGCGGDLEGPNRLTQKRPREENSQER